METKLDKNKRQILAILPRPLGEVSVTSRALAVLNCADIAQSIGRHVRCDWGEVSKRCWKANDVSAQHGHQVRSEYIAKNGKRFCVITESDRSATTVLLPEEYLP